MRADLSNTATLMHDNLRLCQRRLDRLGRPKDFGEFFESPTPCLDVEEVDEGEFKHVPENEDKVVLFSNQLSGLHSVRLKLDAYLPPSTGKRDSRHKSIVKPSNVDPEIVKGHALCTRLVAQTFHRVQLLQGCVPSRVHESEDEDKGNNSFGLARALDELSACVVNHGLSVWSVDDIGSDEGDDDAENAHNETG
jgi:hypothetical protein